MPDAQMYQQMPDAQMYQQMPDAQMYQQMPDAQMYQQMPEMQMYQQMPEMQMMYQQPGMEIPYQTMPGMEIPFLASLASPEPDDGSEGCKAKQASNPLHSNMAPLTIGNVYCSQAADSRWWDVTVKAMNCDGSYSVEVKDEVGTKWPVSQRAYFLEKSCDDFYREALTDEGLSPEEIEASLQKEGFHLGDSAEVFNDPSSATGDLAPEEARGAPTEDLPTEETAVPVATEEQPKKSRWPSFSDKKTPWKVVAGAAAAGAVPLIYGVTGGA